MSSIAETESKITKVFNSEVGDFVYTRCTGLKYDSLYLEIALGLFKMIVRSNYFKKYDYSEMLYHELKK